MAYQSIEVHKLTPSIGAEIFGVDLAKPLGNQQFQEVHDALMDNLVVFFRDQKMSIDQHKDFGRRFGPLHTHPNAPIEFKDHPEILVISNIEEDGKLIGLADTDRVAVWHTDTSYRAAPSMGSALHALEIPHDDKGEPIGDTLFASTFLAYDALPADMKRRLEGLRAVHRMTKGYDSDKGAAGDGKPAARLTYDASQRDEVRDQAHPIVRTHPVTGRKCIYVNKLCCTGIVGMPDAESGPLLDEIYAHCTQPQFIYRHRWRVGDLLMWDNCSLQHLAVPDYALLQRRRMHRTTIAGSVPF